MDLGIRLFGVLFLATGLARGLVGKGRDARRAGFAVAISGLVCLLSPQAGPVTVFPMVILVSTLSKKEPEPLALLGTPKGALRPADDRIEHLKRVFE